MNFYRTQAITVVLTKNNYYLTLGKKCKVVEGSDKTVIIGGLWKYFRTRDKDKV